MAKIILTKGGKILQEIALVKERITIGRRAHNDVIIEHASISGEHAVLYTNFGEVLLEDLNSTNGTEVNGQPIRKHFLWDQDVVELAGYGLRYCADTRAGSEGPSAQGNPDTMDINLDSFLENVYPRMWSALVCASIRPRSSCAIKLMTGTGAGKEIALVKPLTTLGRPGLQIAAIVQRMEGFCLTHVEGKPFTLINGCPIGSEFHALSHGDLIGLAGMQIKFCSC